MTTPVTSYLLHDSNIARLEGMQTINDQTFTSRTDKLWDAGRAVIRRLMDVNNALSAIEASDEVDYAKFLDAKDDINSLIRKSNNLQELVTGFFAKGSSENIVVKGAYNGADQNLVMMYNTFFEAIVANNSPDDLFRSEPGTLDEAIMARVVSVAEKLWVTWYAAWATCEVNMESCATVATEIEDDMAQLKFAVSRAEQ